MQLLMGISPPSPSGDTALRCAVAQRSSSCSVVLSTQTLRRLVVELKRADGQPVGVWNNSPVTATLLTSTDPALPSYPPFFGSASGVWAQWALEDGRPPSYPYPSPLTWTTASRSFMHRLEVRTTDVAGNIEQQNISIGIDTTNPSSQFTNLKSEFFRCTKWKPSWTASDTPSGVKTLSLTLDDRLISGLTAIDMSRLTGTRHTLKLSATDFAGNRADTYGRFDVHTETSTVVGPPRLSTGVRPRAKKAFMLSGALTPKHAFGQKPIELKFYRLSSGHYVYYRTDTATIDLYGKYKKAVTISRPGTYKVKAVHRYPSRETGFMRFTVRS